MNGNGDNKEGENKGYLKTFDKCPGCGSKERYFEAFLKEMQERGLLNKEILCFDFQQRQGIPLPEQKVLTLLVGAVIPQFNQIWDVCCNCGMIYSVFLGKGMMKKGLEVAQPQQMNRAERRRMGIPGINNPLNS